MPKAPRSAKPRPSSSTSNALDMSIAGKTREKPNERKRARTAKSDGSYEIEDARPQPSVFRKLPLDIIFEIFTYLKPVDLANLAQTNTEFRTTLASPQASTTWKAARKRAANAPGCPSLVSEVSWAKFIYGPSKCLKCDTSNVLNLDFALMRHVCVPCKRKLVEIGNLHRRFPSVRPVVLELIPYTTDHVLPGKKYYWDADIKAMAKIYGDYKRNIDLRKANAKTALQKYRDQRVEHVQEVIKYEKKCRTWLNGFESHLGDEIEERRNQRYNLIAQRFLDLGYEWRDIHVMQDRPESKYDGTLTEQVWERIGPVLQLDIEIARCKRLDKVEASTIKARKALVENLYYGYKLTLRPIEWVHLPPPGFVYTIPAFRSLIYTNLDVPLEAAACKEAAQRLPEYISAFHDSLKARLLRSMADSHASTTGARTSTRPLGDTDTLLSLATSVFSLTSTTACLERSFGFDDLTAQLAYRDQAGLLSTSFWVTMHDSEEGEIAGHTLKHDVLGSKTVEALIAVLGLDPETAQAEDLDRMGTRFLCGNCQSMGWLARLTDHAFNWRGAVLHCVQVHDAAPEAQTWRILTPDERKIVRRAEDTHDPALRFMWSCNHCTDYAEILLSRSAVQSHVREEHDIAEPEEDVDFFHAHPTVRWNPRPQSLSRSLRRAGQTPDATGQADNGGGDAANRSGACIVS
ncbi:uncharacterized protein B0H18DRAFT_638922 [Fomitopsis serialis]|uniref:uncharacterized protein n=1 Tax=Fomitopsis serialis TaxID=139415 RepID=UPI0020087AED|nr:uncharacterized protein B0H18DRAFT_638922 [Neoantrodia serialis]KAH9919310.1 hypothetical protein B0H18DRAFT_638922 [Neoantrodia serialis]